MKSLIPFNRSSLVGKELNYIKQAMEIGQVAGDQTFSRKCQAILEKRLKVPKALLTTSGTHALEMAAFLLEFREGDEVIVPAFTFVSTANAFVVRGGVPVFCDIRPDTLNLDEVLLEKLVTKKTKAIVPVHYAGVGCEMEVIQKISKKYGIPIIEDNAHGLFGKYRGRALGTFGDLCALSFHETKNITCGEGGALLINNPALISRAEIIREKGTNRSNFFRGQVDKYSWVDVGSSYVMSDVLAAFLFGQLENWKKIQEKRKTIWEKYFLNLRSWAGDSGVRMPQVTPGCNQAYHMFYLIFPSLAERSRFIQHLQTQGIKAVFHYLPLNQSPYQRKTSLRPSRCPIAETISDRLVRLPFFTGMTDEDQSRVIRSVLEFSPKSRNRRYRYLQEGKLRR